MCSKGVMKYFCLLAFAAYGFSNFDLLLFSFFIAGEEEKAIHQSTPFLFFREKNLSKSLFDWLIIHPILIRIYLRTLYFMRTLIFWFFLCSFTFLLRVKQIKLTHLVLHRFPKQAIYQNYTSNYKIKLSC